MMRIAYPDEYLAGAGALRILVLGVCLFALFSVAATSLASGGRPGLAAKIGAVSALLVVALNVLFVRQAGYGGPSWRRPRLRPPLGWRVLLDGVSAVYLKYHALIPWLTVVRVGVAGLVAFFAASAVPDETRLWSIVALVGVSLRTFSCSW